MRVIFCIPKDSRPRLGVVPGMLIESFAQRVNARAILLRDDVGSLSVASLLEDRFDSLWELAFLHSARGDQFL